MYQIKGKRPRTKTYILPEVTKVMKKDNRLQKLAEKV